MGLLGPSLRARYLRAAFFLGLAIAICLPMTGLVPPLGYWQTGASMPRGLYIYHHAPPAARGEVIVVRQPEHFDGSWLMKRVAGVAGDLYCWDGERHRINGRVMPPPSPDAIALGIPVWRHCRTVGTGEVVAYGDSPDSYDSRYSGPVLEARLNGIYRPVVVW